MRRTLRAVAEAERERVRRGRSAGTGAEFIDRGDAGTGAGRRHDPGAHIFQLTEQFVRQRRARGDPQTRRCFDGPGATGAADDDALIRTGAQDDLDDHRFRGAHERELRLVAGLARAHERAELFGVEQHLVVEAGEDVSFFDLADRRALRVDEADLDADARGNGSRRVLGARTDVESGVGELGGDGGLGRRSGFGLVLRLRRADETGEQEHVERNLAERVHGGPL